MILNVQRLSNIEDEAGETKLTVSHLKTLEPHIHITFKTLPKDVLSKLII